jgi:hypothetical protein
MTDFPCAKGSPSGLSGLLLRVWTLADGRHCVADIAAAAGTTPDEVVAGLDLLDHVGLLEHDPDGAPASDLPAWAVAGEDAAATLKRCLPAGQG